MAKSFFGGVHPNDMKSLTASKSVEILTPPEQVIIPMSQHIGAPCKPLVEVGDTVKMGQKIGDNAGLCVPVHSSVSGKVVAIEARPHTGGSNVLAVIIENDFQDTPDESMVARESIDELSAEELIEIIHQGGCVGMGGATFPTHVKINSGIGKVDTIIVNAAECEPYITADDRLIREHPEKILGGARVLLKIFGLEKAHIVIESNKPEAIEVLKKELEGTSDIEVMVQPVMYPQGAEKQLCQTVTGREVPPGGLPAAIGCAVFNTASVAAIYDAVWLGRPLFERNVTVGGLGLKDQKNYRVRIGTPFQFLIDSVGGFSTDPYKVLTGGPMMGIAQYDLNVPVIKGTNAVTALRREDCVEEANPTCIRCGKCIEVCPMHLMPLYMYMYEQKSDIEKLKEFNVTDCMECGACTYNCPARIHLVHSFKTAKQKITNANNKAKAEAEAKAKAEEEKKAAAAAKEGN